MDWIESITWSEGGLAPMLISTDRSRRVSTLYKAQGSLPAVRKVWSDAHTFSLSELQACEAAPYLRAFGFKFAVQANHEMYSVSLNGVLHVIPAWVLIHSLVAGTRHQVEDLLRPSGTRPRIFVDFQTGAPRLHLRLRVLVCSHTNKGYVEDRLIWLACFPSAQRMWNSVYLRAVRTGSLGCEIPSANITARFHGKVIGKTKFVTNMVVSVLTPEEAPLPFAESLGQRHFIFHSRIKSHSTSDAAAKARLAKTHNLVDGKLPADASLLGARGRVKLNQAEWLVADSKLREYGHTTVKAPRTKLDLILQKLASGKFWSKFPGYKAAYQTFTFIEKTGALSDVLSTLRVGRDVERSLDVCGSVDGEEPVQQQTSASSSKIFAEIRDVVRSETYYLARGTALAIHGLTTHSDTQIDVVVRIRQTNRQLNGRHLRFLYTRSEKFFGFEAFTFEGIEVPVSDLERTVLDALAMPTNGGIVAACAFVCKAAKRLDCMKLIAYAKRLANDSLNRRLGYILERYQLATPLALEVLKAALVPGVFCVRLNFSLDRTGDNDPVWKVDVNTKLPPLGLML